ncbi:MAG: PilZ domain-containing protein [Candidatus Omnitrophica bacterium]|nr:PilZ domain-containing protein [Candidatus Omnitrophota bacterium]MDD5430012.1 PilZ domain-containing protein [Candidatus Omnitrophota bacterium]
MKKLLVKIEYDNQTANFTAFDVLCAMKNLFGINTAFKIKEISPDNVFSNKISRAREESPLKILTDQRRKSSRAGISFPVKCVNFCQNGGKFDTFSIDLSLGGMKIACSNFLVPKNKVRINIHTGDETLKIESQVIWCMKETGSKNHYAGLEFLGLDEENKLTLEYMLKQRAF